MLDPRFCARAFSSCSEQGPLFIAVRGPLTIAASLVAEHRLQTHRLSNCGSRAQLLRSMWDLPRPGLEPVSPALAGRLSTTAPPGKPHTFILRSQFTQPCLSVPEVKVCAPGDGGTWAGETGTAPEAACSLNLCVCLARGHVGVLQVPALRPPPQPLPCVCCPSPSALHDMPLQCTWS